ncbi:MAG TPA: LppX_LprAFG lipoprotein [Nocardioidaceae bacterium]|nr:LppX_LprAFG lipoprotein [Nocardioidaceae bacterium]
MSLSVRAARILLAVLLCGLLIGPSGCSHDSASSLSPHQALATAKKKLDKTSGVHLHLSTGKLPSGVDGVLDADGVATHAPAFKGSIKVAASGITADVAVVALQGVVYAKLPFTTKFVPIDPHDYGAPNPADLMSTSGGLSSLLTSATHLTKGAQQRNGKSVLDSYHGTVPGRAVATVIPSAVPSGNFDATFSIDDRHRLVRAVLTGPFYAKGGDVTYTIGFDDYGAHPHISKP